MRAELLAIVSAICLAACGGALGQGAGTPETQAVPAPSEEPPGPPCTGVVVEDA